MPLIRLDIDPQQIMRNLAPDIALLGDSKATLQLLLQALQASSDPEPCGAKPRALSYGAQRAQTAREQGLAELTPAMQADIGLLHALRDRMPDALWVGDSTRLVYAGNMGFEAIFPRSWFNSSVGFGSLGYGLPAAVGAALAAPSRTVVCLVGDGGLQFTLAELGTAMEVGARVVLVLLNNAGYGEIKAAMQAIDVETVGVDLYTPDFVAVAKSYGWQAHRLERNQTPSQWAARIGAVVADACGPTLIEILT